MMVIPAVDLRGGRCVRLLQGRAEAETVFSDDPVATARAWAAEGAPRLHVVDLDGAFVGLPKQLGIIEEIVKSVHVPVEAGGGLRSLEAVEALLASGARWALLGTRAALDPVFLAEACRLFPGRIIVAVDASDGNIVVDGWTRRLDVAAVDLARRVRQAGAAEILYTDIARDGTQLGPNLKSAEAVSRAAGLPLLASGGVGSLEDLRRLAAIPGVIGAVVGRALYTGAVQLKQALVELRAC